MARTHIVKKAQKAQGSCQSPTCPHEDRELRIGQPYKWFKIRAYKGGSGQRKAYHVDCVVPRSHRTTSAQLGIIYDAQDTAEQAMAALGPDNESGELQDIAQALADSIREAGEMYGESADNIEEGFGHEVPISEELREKAEGCEDWASNLESLDFTEFDEDDVDGENPNDHGDDYEDAEALEKAQAEYDEAVEQARETWWEEQCGVVEEELSNQPF